MFFLSNLDPLTSVLMKILISKSLLFERAVGVKVQSIAKNHL